MPSAWPRDLVYATEKALIVGKDAKHSSVQVEDLARYTMSDPIANAINNYHDFNATVADELQGEPSPLEFMRFVAKNRPFVARQAATDWAALSKWNARYLQEVMGSQSVKVAVTPLGNADAVVERQDGTLVFVEPHEALEPFNNFLAYVQADSHTITERDQRSVKYAQTQNDNLRDEYSKLFEDVPADIPFARIALEKEADAINLWIGNERSITSLHKDNYENIYVEVRGQKHFVLLPPVEMPCVNEQPLPQARYEPLNGQSVDLGDTLVISEDVGEDSVPVATWDPEVPGERATQYSPLSKPLRVTLNEGDMLYLPAMWYHKVSQTAGDEGFALAVNYWYDMDFDGSFWTGNELMREVVSAKTQAVQYPSLNLKDEI